MKNLTTEQKKKSEQIRYENEFINSEPGSRKNRILSAILGHINKVNRIDKLKKEKNGK